jgi:hypothetical protein
LAFALLLAAAAHCHHLYRLLLLLQLLLLLAACRASPAASGLPLSWGPLQTPPLRHESCNHLAPCDFLQAEKQ